MVNSTHSLNTQTSKTISKPSQPIQSIEQAQESIYRFLLNIAKQGSAEAVLKEFNSLFFQQENCDNLEPIQAINELVAWNNEEEFQYTLKRCCYILINNWKANRKEKYVQQLIEILANSNSKESSTSDRLKSWIQNFVNSKDYEELQIFAAKCQGEVRWGNLYISNLSVSQPYNCQNSVQQRLATKDQAKPQQYRSKLDLAMYMAPSQPSGFNKHSRNPTQLEDEVLRLIRIIVAKREPSSYANIANTFVKQNKATNYQQFKQRLEKYLLYSTDNIEIVDTSKLNLSHKLAALNYNFNEQTLTDALLHRTCNRLIDYLTIENHRTPSILFTSLISQGKHMTLVIALLKIVLICKASRTHLQTCITELMRYYEDASAAEFKLANNFIEIYKVMFAIYIDNVSVKLD